MEAPTLKNHQGHSAQVRMELRLNGRVLPIAQMGPDFVVLRQPVDHAPAEAEIFLRIDDSESNWRVHLVEGISTERRKTKIANAAPAADPPME
jgi:hypothetical protein